MKNYPLKKYKRLGIALILSVIPITLLADPINPSIDIALPKIEEEPEKVSGPTKPVPKPKLTEEQLTSKIQGVLEDIVKKRNKYILTYDDEGLKSLYNMDIKLSTYAYEYEAIKIKYLKNWCEKQGIVFDSIDTVLRMRKVRDRGEGLYGMTCNMATTFSYSYINEPSKKNSFKLGTNHYIHLKETDGNYAIVKEWYTDPFADSLALEDIDSKDIKTYILNHTPPEYTMNARTKKAVEYAHLYCGIGDGEHLFKYNKDYMNCNPLGGDCANFASQILYEGGGFKKNGTWNYVNEGTKAWVNAQAFKNYMVHSGRASYIAKGSYEDVYKEAYSMRPGDFVAYEKKGRIVHISTVTGLDSKGYPLVTCHNTDRLLVPYDLGWSNKKIRFHLIDVHY